MRAGSRHSPFCRALAICPFRRICRTRSSKPWMTVSASEVRPKFISPSDPAAQWTGAHKGHAFFAYATNYLIDTDNAVILDVEASRAIRQAEVGASRTMIDRTAGGLASLVVGDALERSGRLGLPASFHVAGR